MALPPDTDDRKVIDEVIERMGRNAPADRARAYQAFTDGETGKADRFEGWLIPKLVNDPAWKPQPTEADTASAAEVTALEYSAFIGKGNATARGKIVTAIGKDEADKIARAYGLTGVGDFKSFGKPPPVAAKG